MLDLKDLLSRLDDMTPNQVNEMLRAALDESGIDYSTDGGTLTIEDFSIENSEVVIAVDIELTFSAADKSNNKPYDNMLYDKKLKSIDPSRIDGWSFEFLTNDDNESSLNAA